jgi:hypothetical protein
MEPSMEILLLSNHVPSACIAIDSSMEQSMEIVFLLATHVYCASIGIDISTEPSMEIKYSL